MQFAYRLSLLFALAMLASGCRMVGAGTMKDVRLDWNRYRACTVRFERRDHLPSRTDHIRWFRWLHHESPQLPPCEEEMLRGPDWARTGMER